MKMNRKYMSWIVLVLGIFMSTFGLFWFLAILSALTSFTLGVLIVLYLQHGSLDTYLNHGLLENPLEETKTLGLNLVYDQKPIMLISPNIKIQTESKKYKILSDNRKKSIIDSGFELIFKKHSKHIKDGHLKTNITDHLLHKGSPFRSHTILENKDDHHNNHHPHHHSYNYHHNQHHSSNNSEDKKWKPFESIKIYTEKKKSNFNVHDEHAIDGKHGDISFGEECSGNFSYNSSTESLSTPHKKTSKTILSGSKQIDQLLHLIIDYVLRDFIDSWFCSITDNKEFNEIRARNCIEEFVTNVCNRIKTAQWLPLITTKVVEDIATHTKLYRLATQTIAAEKVETKRNDEKYLSPQRKSKKSQHKRNKSDTELNWVPPDNLSAPKNVANSKFYTAQPKEPTLIDPSLKLLEAFFNNCDLYKKECLDETSLEKYLTHLTETILYFTLPEEDFSCLPLRTFLSTLLANVVFKPVLDMLSDPDFINLQVARLFSKDPPSGEYLIKMVRQCSDLSELRACRQLITREMDLKFKDSNSSAELASLRYTQKLIDLRISSLQNNVSAVDFGPSEKERISSNLPILTLDELLTKELALSYYLDYLSILNLQKYVIFYLTAQEWKQFTTEHIGKSKTVKEDIMKSVRDRAWNLYEEYLTPTSTNLLNIDAGLIETLSFKLKDSTIMPDNTWFDSTCKFIYEKLKNEDIFLNNFYQSSAYKKLILELELEHPELNSDNDMDMVNISDTGSDTNLSDINFDDDEDDDKLRHDGFPEIKLTLAAGHNESEFIKTGYDLSVLPFLNAKTSNGSLDKLDITNYKHARSHSDCTGIIPISNIQGSSNNSNLGTTKLMIKNRLNNDTEKKFHYNANEIRALLPDEVDRTKKIELTTAKVMKNDFQKMAVGDLDIDLKQKISAKIINTAIHYEGQYAVYAIHVSIIEHNHQKSWHIYRRYSRFLELKKILVKRFPQLSKIPFPAKKAFHNTQRSVLEHRMSILNDFLNEICIKAENNEDIYNTIEEFVEPDANDKKVHGGAVVRTLETIVNPFKSGIRTIRNIPDNFISGLSKIFLGRSQFKEASFLQVPNSIPLEQKSSEYPALTSALKLLDEIFDLQSRSQWLRRGIINRLLGAPWVSHTANKKILQTAKSMIELDKVEVILASVLNNIWPDGKQQRRTPPREDNTKLLTRMAAKIALFALVADDLKHVVGSETTRSGLLNFFQMLQNKKLNLRLVLILLNHILTVLYKTDNMTKHVN